jgi:hypothetical protein
MPLVGFILLTKRLDHCKADSKNLFVIPNHSQQCAAAGKKFHVRWRRFGGLNFEQIVK